MATYTQKPDKDCTVKSDSPTTNWETWDDIVTLDDSHGKGGDDIQWDVFFRMDFSAIGAVTSDQVTDAYFWCREYVLAGAPSPIFYRLTPHTNDFDAATITWNNQWTGRSLDTGIHSGYPVLVSGHWYKVDITDMIKDAIDSRSYIWYAYWTHYGWTASVVNQFAAYDIHSYGYKPYIVINYTPGGTTYYQAVSATSAGAPSVVKSPRKLVSAISTGTPTLVKSPSKILLSTSNVTPSVVKKANKPLSVVSPGSSLMVKSARKLLLPTVASAAAMVRQAGKVLLVTPSGTPLIVKAATKTLPVTATSVPVVLKQANKPILATSTGTPSMLRAMAKTLLATSAGVPGVVKQVLTQMATTVSSTASIVRGVGIVLSVVSSSTITFTRKVSHTLYAVVSSIPYLLAVKGGAAVVYYQTLAAFAISSASIVTRFLLRHGLAPGNVSAKVQVPPMDGSCDDP